MTMIILKYEVAYYWEQLLKIMFRKCVPYWFIIIYGVFINNIYYCLIPDHYQYDSQFSYGQNEPTVHPQDHDQDYFLQEQHKQLLVEATELKREGSNLE